MKEMLPYQICPDENALALFMEGKLEGQNYLLVKQHVETCEICNESIRWAMELGALDKKKVISKYDKVVNLRAAKAARNLCVLYAEHYLLEKYGYPVALDHLISTAIYRRWLGKKGIKFKNIGKLLELFQMYTERHVSGSLADISKALSEGSDVIVGVDAGELFAHSPIKKFKEKVEDLFEQRPDHALIITEVKKDKTGYEIELINFENNLQQKYTIPEVQFMNAWKDSGFYWVKVTRSI